MAGFTPWQVHAIRVLLSTSHFAADAAKMGHQTARGRWRCVGGKPGKLHYVIRNYSASNTRSDGARSTADLAAQPELGICPERRTGLDSGHPAGPVLTWQNLSLGRRYGFGVNTP